VRSSTRDRVEIVATKTWRRGDPKRVRIETKKSADGSILVCAFWTENATCDEDGYRSHNEGRWDRNDVAVDFEVRLPKSVNARSDWRSCAPSAAGARASTRAMTAAGERNDIGRSPGMSRTVMDAAPSK
jgi:hypothetical protein